MNEKFLSSCLNTKLVGREKLTHIICTKLIGVVDYIEHQLWTRHLRMLQSAWKPFEVFHVCADDEALCLSDANQICAVRAIKSV